MSKSQQSSALRELRTLWHGKDVPALRQLYLREGENLARAAGRPPPGVNALLSRSDADVVRGTARVLELARHRSRRESQERRVSKSGEAAVQLVTSARWKDDRVYLDCRLLLGELLSAPAKFFHFDVDGAQYYVDKARLVRLRPLTKRMDGLFAFSSDDALCIRWKGGRGGLNLRTSLPGRAEADDVLPLVFERPRQPAPRTVRGDRLFSLVLNTLRPLISP